MPDRVLRRRAPAERARDEDVEVARAVELHRPLDLRLEVVQVGDRRGRDVGNLVRHRDQRRVLALAEDVPRLGADRLRVRGARRGRCRARALDAGVHVRLVVVTDVEHVVVRARTSRTGRRSRCRSCRRRRPGRSRGRRSRPLRLAAPPRCPLATAGAFPNSECSHGSCQDDSGYGVEKTSRQPVAFAAISRPSVARIAASRT